MSSSLMAVTLDPSLPVGGKTNFVPPILTLDTAEVNLKIVAEISAVSHAEVKRSRNLEIVPVSEYAPADITEQP